MIKKTFGLAALAAVTFAGAAEARDQINIVGSSTVYPFATVVAEQFGKTSGFKTPKIESTGSGGGLKLFCAGVGVEHPDVDRFLRREPDRRTGLPAGGVRALRAAGFARVLRRWHVSRAAPRRARCPARRR